MSLFKIATLIIALTFFSSHLFAQRKSKQERADNNIPYISNVFPVAQAIDSLTIHEFLEKTAIHKVTPKYDTFHDFVLVANNHPFFPLDNSALQDLAREMVNRNPEFCYYIVFKNGKELLEILKILTKVNGYIRNLALVGHSGYEGYFAEEGAGFHRTSYKMMKGGKVIPLSENAATVSDLDLALQEGSIKFDPSGTIVLAGCNTAHGTDNFAFEFAKTVKLPVIGSDHKIDLFNVQNKGEELIGKDGTFFVYLPVNSKILKFDFGTPVIQINSAINKVRQLKEEMIKKESSK